MEDIEKRKKLLKEILRYLVTGLVATIFDYTIFSLFRFVILTDTLTNLFIATFLGFVIGLMVNYLLSIFYVFKDVKDKTHEKKFLCYSCSL